MKTFHTTFKFFALLLIILTSLSGFAQRKTTTPVYLSQQPTLNTVKAPNDTLQPGNVPNVIPNYVMIAADNGGYVLGTNGWNDKCKCQEFKTTYNYKIEGAIYWFGYKRADSAGLVKFSVWDMDGTTGTTHDTTNQPCPGTLFMSLTDTTTKIDTSSQIDQAYVVMFPFPILVTSNYCIGFDMSQIKGDSIAMVSTSSGQGGHLELVWEQWSSNNKWYTLQGAQWDSSTLDIDAMILPIIDNTVGCVENGDFISGIKLSNSYPNPNPGECTIRYELSTPQTFASIEIIDLSGKRVYFNNTIATSEGIHQNTIDVSALKNGTYFYILSTSSARIAKKLIVSK
ncbi:MAG: T9SS type A sorting domain-containing protein [Bacteroidota bacterium]